MFFDEFPVFLKLVAMTFFALFPVVNPIGSAFIIHGMTRSLNDAEYKKLSTKIATYMVGLILTFLILGPFFLKLFGLSISSVQVGGGIVLTAMGFRLLNNDDKQTDEKDAAAANARDSVLEGKAFYPLTFPITSGPGTISVTLTLSAHSLVGYTHSLVVNFLAAGVGVLIMGLTVYFSYVYLPRVTTRLSQSGLIALNKILAFVILCIGVEIFLNGVRSILH